MHLGFFTNENIFDFWIYFLPFWFLKKKEIPLKTILIFDFFTKKNIMGFLKKSEGRDYFCIKYMILSQFRYVFSYWIN